MPLWITLTRDSLNYILKMKNFLAIVFLMGLLWSNVSLADNLKIVDGDTIVLNGEKVRFFGIDTTELKQTCLEGNEEVGCGRFAKMLLVKKIGNNTPKCIGEKKDFYKRTLAECFVNGESLSKFLVRSGYAFAYRKYSTKFIKDENFAKANKLGMWSMTFQYPWDFRKGL